MAEKPVVHFEIMGPDGSVMKEFYEALFGWKTEEVPGFGGYYMVSPDQAGVGGALGKGNENMPSYMTMYIEVDSIDDHLEVVKANGGQTLVPRTVVPDTVVFALFSDPAGNMVGLVEPGTPSAE